MTAFSGQALKMGSKLGSRLGLLIKYDNRHQRQENLFLIKLSLPPRRSAAQPRSPRPNESQGCERERIAKENNGRDGSFGCLQKTLLLQGVSCERHTHKGLTGAPAPASHSSCLVTVSKSRGYAQTHLKGLKNSVIAEINGRDH